MTIMREVDRAALERGIEIALRDHDPGRREQIRDMLRNDPWWEVATFCAYGNQRRTLRLRPWQDPPCFINDPDNPEPRQEAAAALLRKMLANGVSKYDPDPLAAVEGAKERKA
jgi:hypothetical protein